MTDSNDWRVTISLSDPAAAKQARQVISAYEASEDGRRRLGRAVAVGAGGSQVFLYAGNEMAAREAGRVARGVLARRGLQADITLHRWHPVEEEWEAADVAMPRTEAELRAEHQRLEDSETAESRAAGVAEWEARAGFGSHHEAVAMADKLRREGYPVVRRWKFLLAGADNEDDAQRLAEHIRQLAPSDATVRVEHSGLLFPFMPW